MGKGETPVTDAERLWVLCAEALRPAVSPAAWRMWFAPVQPSWADQHRLVLTVPSALAKERLTTVYLDAITEAVTEVTGNPVTIDFVVGSTATSVGGQCPAPAPAPALADQPVVGPAPAEAPAGRERGPLQAHFTFDAFVTADSNRFAHAAATVVAETPGLAYNPLVIYGDSGLGKTHLLHAIGNYVIQHFPNYRVRYAPTESCMNEFVDAIRSKTTLDFKRRYRECDVLLMDDFQFIMNSDRLGEEFFYTFNELQEASKQIVIVSDRPPTAMGSLEDRFRSRLLSGLVTNVQPPDLETRLAILRKKAERQSSTVPDEVLDLIANNIRDNIRELEGALIRVTAFARHNDEPLTLGLAEKVLSDVLGDGRARRITPQGILEATAEQYGFTVADLQGPSRRRPLVTARQIAMYVMRNQTDYSFPMIAREFGGRDHTTVIHAVQKIEALMQERRAIYEQVNQLIRRLTER